MSDRARIIAEVAEYYEQKLEKFGCTPAGVDWNSSQSQTLRFEQLLRVVGAQETAFTLLDYGCGYGALFDFCAESFPRMSFTGFDLSPRMIEAARSEPGRSRATWVTALRPEEQFDFVVASGIFNVRLEQQTEAWERYIFATLDDLAARSKKGFAFNMLTSFSDADKKRANLYYGQPGRFLDHCIGHYSRHTALFHDYQLYEFTVLVKKG
ncbi:MAG: class I SAM-dependent methyltransferase [Bdellovibrionota bacterium]